MGRSYTPEFRIETREYGKTGPSKWESAAWPKGVAPTNSNLADHVFIFHESMKPGKPNAHLADLGIRIVEARIVHQKTNVTVAKWNAPLFEVID